MPGIGTGIRGRIASRTMTTEKNKTQIASVLCSANFVKPPSKGPKSLSLERDAKTLSETNPKAANTSKKKPMEKCSVMPPVEGCISERSPGFRTQLYTQVRYRITDFTGLQASWRLFRVPKVVVRDLYCRLTAKIASRARVSLGVRVNASILPELSPRQSPRQEGDREQIKNRN